MFTVHRRVGRLVEARIHGLSTVDDVLAYGRAFDSSIMGRGKPVLCADHRLARIYKQPVADKLVELLVTFNHVWERVAIVVAQSNVTLAMQLQRIVRESSADSRLVFFEPRDVVDFLGPCLVSEERVRVREFLDETPTAKRPR